LPFLALASFLVVIPPLLSLLSMLGALSFYLSRRTLAVLISVAIVSVLHVVVVLIVSLSIHYEARLPPRLSNDDEKNKQRNKGRKEEKHTQAGGLN
jgi:hypothetical protein